MVSDFVSVVNHISIGTNDLSATSVFYDAVMATFGAERKLEIPNIAIAYGIRFPEFWVQRPLNQELATVGNGTHIAFHTQSTEVVDLFYRTALAKGGSDGGPPGFRPEYGEHYYCAFVFDLDGHKIEAMHMPFETSV